jgi:FAD dependent oxidoreductase
VALKNSRIAILGAGGVGVCTALELARRGYSVDLYDENAQAITRASENNEGKIHLGLVYAKDPSLRTARTMIQGAIHFVACLQRWIDVDPNDISTPFYYGVHHGTMMSAEALDAHYGRCKQLLEEACSATGLSYLGVDRTLQAERTSRRELETLVEGDHFESLFRTSERAINPRAIARLLRRALEAAPRIRFIGNARISSAAWASDRIQISFSLNGEHHADTYDHVANTLWHGRLAIDAELGLAPPQGWIHRFKLGGWINTPIDETAIPSMTIVLGPFGDVVNFGPAGWYFSWYPTGLVGTSLDLQPPDWNAALANGDRLAMLRSSYEEVSKRLPPLRSMPYSDGLVQPAGGMIFAWGRTDIDVADSKLHTRHEIGIHSTGHYHSVNTGKYTMVPYLGQKTAERILGIS